MIVFGRWPHLATFSRRERFGTAWRHLNAMIRHSKVLPVKLPMASVPNVIVTVKNRALSPVVRLFIEQAPEVAKPLAKRKR